MAPYQSDTAIVRQTAPSLFQKKLHLLISCSAIAQDK